MKTIIFTVLIPGIILFLALNLVARELFRRYHEMKKQAEREAALAESLTTDFTREAKTLKRVEVQDPAARILCVDDEAVILDSLRKILVLDGYNVDTVETGQEALGLVQTRDYDFVFTDLKMPSMPGTEVAKSVKFMRPDVDVVIITGYATVESAVECMKHGAMDYTTVVSACASDPAPLQFIAPYTGAAMAESGGRTWSGRVPATVVSSSTSSCWPSDVSACPVVSS